jgi:predicted aconitase
MNCSLGAAAGVALLAIAALAQEQQPTTDLDKIIEIAIASIETRSATSYEITARDRTLDLITLTAPDTARTLAKVLCSAVQQHVTFAERWHLRVFTVLRGRRPAATCDLKKGLA